MRITSRFLSPDDMKKALTPSLPPPPPPGAGQQPKGLHSYTGATPLDCGRLLEDGVGTEVLHHYNGSRSQGEWNSESL